MTVKVPGDMPGWTVPPITDTFPVIVPVPSSVPPVCTFTVAIPRFTPEAIVVVVATKSELTPVADAPVAKLNVPPTVLTFPAPLSAHAMLNVPALKPRITPEARVMDPPVGQLPPALKSSSEICTFTAPVLLNVTPTGSAPPAAPERLKVPALLNVPV